MSTAHTALALRDLQLGQVFETASVVIAQGDIVAFATAFDPQPMHLDEAAAGETVFRRLVASGWHVAALTMKLMVEARPFGSTPIVGAGIERLRFRRPVLPGMRLRCRAVVDALEEAARPGQGYVTLTVETADAETGSVVLSQQWKLLVPARQLPG